MPTQPTTTRHGCVAQKRAQRASVPVGGVVCGLAGSGVLSFCSMGLSSVDRPSLVGVRVRSQKRRQPRYGFPPGWGSERYPYP